MRSFSFKIYFISLFICSPVFINLGISNGLRFDAEPFNLLGAPSIPISLIFFCLMVLTNFFKLKFTKSEFIFISIILFYVLLNIIFSMGIRPVLLALGMLIFVININLISNILKRYTFDVLLRSFYFALSSIIILKLLADILIFNQLFTKYFIFDFVVIYSFYDYFPFLYLLVLSMTIFYIKNRQLLVLSLSNFVICFIAFILCHSRLFLGLGILYIPLLVFLRYVPIKFYITFSICNLLVVFFTLFVSISGFSVSSDASLVTRFGHWYHFFEAFSLSNIVLPFQNSYRLEMNWGTFHNEYLEIFSYFGFALFLYIYVVFQKTKALQKQNKIEAQVLVLFLILGGLVQLNMTNPYIIIALSFYLGILKKRNDGV